MTTNKPVAWKAYEEVNFNDQYNLRWLREGDDYVNRITKEMMEDLKAVVLRQQTEIGFYKQDADRYKLKCASQQAEIEALKIKHDAIACSSCVCGFIKRGKAQEK